LSKAHLSAPASWKTGLPLAAVGGGRSNSPRILAKDRLFGGAQGGADAVAEVGFAFCGCGLLHHGLRFLPPFWPLQLPPNRQLILLEMTSFLGAVGIFDSLVQIAAPFSFPSLDLSGCPAIRSESAMPHPHCLFPSNSEQGRPKPVPGYRCPSN